MARKFFNDDQFNFELQFAMGGVHYGAGDLGEMLSTADRIVDGDADSWCQEWIATGQRVATIAEERTPFRHDWEHVITPVVRPASTPSPMSSIRSRHHC